MKHLNLRVHGRVQGVFYRATARDHARRLGLNGLARNEPDGSVYIEVEGDEPALQQFVQWCEVGPDRAQVEHVAVEEGPLRNLRGFVSE